MSNSRYWINKDKKLVLIYSPKCACTSLHTAFIRNISEIKDKKDPRFLAGKNHYVKQKYIDIPKTYFIYWGIRNPFDRIVSCYFNKFVLYKTIRLNENNLESFSNELLQKIGIKYNDLTFNNFLYGIKNLMSKNISINHHFDTQVNKNNYNLIKKHPKLFLFDINNIPEIFNINYKLNETKLPENYIIEDLCNTKAKDININSLVKENFVNSKELIRDIYKLDYKIFEKHNIIY